MYHVFYVGYLATFLKTICFLPLVYKVYKYDKTDELSLLMYTLLTIMMFCWIVYSTNGLSFKDKGKKKVDYSLFIANGISVCFVLYILFKIVYNSYFRK